MGSLRRESTGTAHKGEAGMEEIPWDGVLLAGRVEGREWCQSLELEETTWSTAVGQRVRN